MENATPMEPMYAFTSPVSRLTQSWGFSRTSRSTSQPDQIKLWPTLIQTLNHPDQTKQIQTLSLQPEQNLMTRLIHTFWILPEKKENIELLLESNQGVYILSLKLNGSLYICPQSNLLLTHSLICPYPGA